MEIATGSHFGFIFFFSFLSQIRLANLKVLKKKKKKEEIICDIEDVLGRVLVGSCTDNKISTCT